MIDPNKGEKIDRAVLISRHEPSIAPPQCEVRALQRCQKRHPKSCNLHNPSHTKNKSLWLRTPSMHHHPFSRTLLHPFPVYTCSRANQASYLPLPRSPASSPNNLPASTQNLASPLPSYPT